MSYSRPPPRVSCHDARPERPRGFSLTTVAAKSHNLCNDAALALNLHETAAVSQVLQRTVTAVDAASVRSLRSHQLDEALELPGACCVRKVLL